MNEYQLEITVQICCSGDSSEQRSVSMPISIAVPHTIDQLCGNIAATMHEYWNAWQTQPPHIQSTNQQEILH